MAFVKLHGSILDSSIWSQSDTTRIVWITMLAMANQDGVVEASVDGLARRGAVSIEACEIALSALLGPDPRSRDGTTGERVEKVPGGWLVLNHANYREQRTREQIATAKRVAKHRAKLKAERSAATGNATESYNGQLTPTLANSPSEAEADTDTEKKRAAPPARRSLKAIADPDTELRGSASWLDAGVRRWLAYRSEGGRKPYTPSGLRALIGQARDMGEVRLTAALGHSMAGGYQGLFDAPQRNGQPVKKGMARANAGAYEGPAWKVEPRGTMEAL